jgi:hypothetical protein
MLGGRSAVFHADSISYDVIEKFLVIPVLATAERINADRIQRLPPF